MNLALEVKAEMTQNATTVKRLAHSVGMCRNALSSRLNGHTDFKANELTRIGSVLGVRASELLRRAEENATTTTTTSAATTTEN